MAPIKHSNEPALNSLTMHSVVVNVVVMQQARKAIEAKLPYIDVDAVQKVLRDIQAEASWLHFGSLLQRCYRKEEDKQRLTIIVSDFKDMMTDVALYT